MDFGEKISSPRDYVARLQCVGLKNLPYNHPVSPWQPWHVPYCRPPRLQLVTQTYSNPLLDAYTIKSENFNIAYMRLLSCYFLFVFSYSQCVQRIAPAGQTISQLPQPSQFFLITFTVFSDFSIASNQHVSRHFSQPMHSS